MREPAVIINLKTEKRFGKDWQIVTFTCEGADKPFVSVPYFVYRRAEIEFNRAVIEAFKAGECRAEQTPWLEKGDATVSDGEALEAVERLKAEDYLREPYARVLIPDAESGGFTAKILEFPGCITEGDTPEEALKCLEDAAAGWIEACLGMGQEIPAALASMPYRGTILLHLPRTLHQRVVEVATTEGVSMNQYLLAVISAAVGGKH